MSRVSLFTWSTCRKNLKGALGRLWACPNVSTSLSPTVTFATSTEDNKGCGKKVRAKKAKKKESTNGAPETVEEKKKLRAKKTKKENTDGASETAKKRKPRKSKTENTNGASAEPQIKRKREKKPPVSDEELKSSLLGPFIPFEGEDSESEGLHSGTFSIQREDSPGGRLYHIKSSTAHDNHTYSFPSVTSILDSTVEKASYYRLLVWKRKLTEKHGLEGFDKIVKNTLKSGSNFHKDLESKLMHLSSKRDLLPTELMGPSDISLKPTQQSQAPHAGKVGLAENKVGEEANSKSTSKVKEDCESCSTQANTASKSAAMGEEVGKESESHTLEFPLKDPTLSYSHDSAENTNHEQQAAGNGTLNGDDHGSAEEAEPPRYIESVEHILRDIGKVVAMETPVAHFGLGYMGTFDCLAEYQGQLCLIDWKTARRLKPTLADCYDYPLQAVAYAGAVNQDPTLNIKVLNLLIVVAYASGEPAHAHLINHQLCQRYWLQWLHRLQTYQTQFSQDLSEIIT